uniref:Uncharacterized protein n=1 Tax=Rhizophora mucronata TaxID=61149 RepID=A0A2P2PZ70_RHIMU
MPNTTGHCVPLLSYNLLEFIAQYSVL